MTLGEVEVALKRLTDNQVGQGELLGRVERVTEENSEAITRLTDGLRLMQAAMSRLFEQMDRLIGWLEGSSWQGA